MEEITKEQIEEINRKSKLNEIQFFKKMSRIIFSPEIKRDRNLNTKYSLKNLNLEEISEIHTLFWVYGQNLGLSDDELEKLGYPKKRT